MSVEATSAEAVEDGMNMSCFLLGCRLSTVQRDDSASMCLQDITELDFNGQAIDGLGPLSYEAQRGMYLHATYTVSAQRVPLGVLNAWMWARQRKSADGCRGGLPQSVRWVEGYERLTELAVKLPAKRLVCTGDRESDLMALLLKARNLGHTADYLLR